jgi:hypothetical protein
LAVLYIVIQPYFVQKKEYYLNSHLSSEVRMKYTQKTKYFIYGVIATAVLIPLGTYAVKTIPVTFSEGDVLSASVLNSLMDRINDTQKGFSSNSELVGTWTCTSYTVRNDCDASWSTHSSVLKKITQNVVISTNGSILDFSAATTNVGDCTGLGPGRKSLNADVIGANIALSNTGSGLLNTAKITKLSPSTFNLDYAVNVTGDTFAQCTKTLEAPAPADALTATVSGTSVALAWTDQSTDETGFKVQYKTSAKGTWTTATTTAANATSYSITGLTAGTYWIRVVAKNANGDSMSSSETQAVVQ